MDQNRPRGREKNVIGGTGSVNKRGSGLGTGPVGTTNGRTGTGGSSSGGRRIRSTTPNLGKGKLLLVIIILLLVFGGGGGLSGLLGGDSYDSADYSDSSSGSNFGSGADTWQSTGSSNAKLNTSVAAEARDKYTKIYGDGKDTVTIMVYVCGTDLESRSGMATSDIKEMASAKLSDNVNVIIYTGGCKAWKNDVISSSKNQIYQIKDGGLVCLEKDCGSDAMTKPATLTSFIQYCNKNFPANRNELILWDHGGGSISGYGYDEKNSSAGSMGLAGINTALQNAGVKFDFIGFDTCLMATMENALMLTQYADYMIASEETEPGVGWYYTNWLTQFSKNTSMPTIEVGKNIVDDFVDVCAMRCNGQKTTLSVVDLAELEKTIPEKLTAFSTSTKDLIQEKEYQVVSDARYHTREFAQSSQIDQVDLVHLAQNMNTAEGKELVTVIKNAVKYNRTSTNMTNANGISIYFPYKKTSKVNQALSAYKQIGMDTEYGRCIQEFASMEVGGQMSGGGTQTASPVGSLMGSLLEGTLSQSGSSSASGGSSDLIMQMLGSMLSGDGSGVGLDSSAISFFSGKSMDTESMADYLSDHYFDATALVWSRESDGSHKLKLSEEQWSLIQSVDLNVFYDDGEGFIDLGLDNVYEFDSQGNLIGDYDWTWLSINGQPVAYYHLDTSESGDEYSITGYVPAMLNGECVELILVFDNANPKGYISGARNVYKNGETETVAKNLFEVGSGDTLEFICDYYSYDGTYQDSYYLGDPMTLGDEVVIGNIDIGAGNVEVTYRLTDIYQQTYWTPVVPE